MLRPKPRSAVPSLECAMETRSDSMFAPACLKLRSAMMCCASAWRSGRRASHVILPACLRNMEHWCRRRRKARSRGRGSTRESLTLADMLLLLRDAALHPLAFCWFGAIPKPEMDAWVQRTGLTVPQDLIELWKITGGGDVFESETILRPTVPSVPNSAFVEDDIESRNVRHNAEGKTEGLLVFQDGAFLSAVRFKDQRFVTLTNSYAVRNAFVP